MNENTMHYVVKDIANDYDNVEVKTGEHKKTNVSFTYITKATYKEIVDANNDMVAADDSFPTVVNVGSCALKPIKEKTDETEVDDFDTVIFEKEVPVSRGSRKMTTVIGLETRLWSKCKFGYYTKGYLYVGDHTFVGLCKNWLIPLLIILGILAFLWGMTVTVVEVVDHFTTPPYIETDPDYDPDQEIWTGTLPGMPEEPVVTVTEEVVEETTIAVSEETEPVKETEQTSGESIPVIKDDDYAEDYGDWDGSMPKSGKDSVAAEETIVFPGYSVIVLEDCNGTVDLINPTTNTVDFTYTLLDANGEELYTTSKIRPGKFVPFSIGKLFNAHGSYSCQFVVNTYDVNTGAECTGVTIPITLTILN